MTNLSQRQRERDWKREKKREREREHGLDRLRKAMDIFSVSSIDEVSVRVHLRRPSQRQLETLRSLAGRTRDQRETWTGGKEKEAGETQRECRKMGTNRARGQQANRQKDRWQQDEKHG